MSKLRDLIPKQAPEGAEAKTKRSPKRSLAEIEEYLSEFLEIRYNAVNTQTEYRKRNTHEEWQEMTNRSLLSIWRGMDQEGIKTNTQTILNVMRSDFAEEVDPVQQFFETTKWDKKTRIPDLAGTVKTEDPGEFAAVLRKWLIATAANATQDGCQNATILIFTGGEGTGKSTWFRSLLPPDLKGYYYEGKIIDPGHKDVQKLCAFKMLIALEETIGNITRKEANTLKALISQDNVELRFEHEKLMSRMRRRASFCATTNDSHFLTAEAGTRRYLPFEVQGFDWEGMKKIDYAQIWAEAYHAAKSGEKYHITSEEVEKMAAHNERYTLISREEEAIQTLFAHPDKIPPQLGRYYEIKHLSATEICTLITERYKFQPFPNKIGGIMKKMGFSPEMTGPKANRRRAYIVAVHDITMGPIPEEEPNPPPF